MNRQTSPAFASKLRDTDRIQVEAISEFAVTASLIARIDYHREAARAASPLPAARGPEQPSHDLVASVGCGPARPYPGRTPSLAITREADCK